MMLKKDGLSLHTVPSGAKWVGSLFSRRHHVILGTPTPQSFAGITEVAAERKLVLAIGRTVSLSEAIPAIAALETTGVPKGKLVIAPE